MLLPPHSCTPPVLSATICCCCMLLLCSPYCMLLLCSPFNGKKVANGGPYKHDPPNQTPTHRKRERKERKEKKKKKKRLPIDGNAVTGVSSISRPATLCYELLGRSLSEGNFASLRFTWLKVIHGSDIPSDDPESCWRGGIMAIIPSSAHVHSNLWCTSVPVINFQIVEWYHGDRVLYQFGYIQYIPTLPVRLGKIHGMNRKGK
ncbi:hypothetical protein J1N35_041107 [Gossypium stocksii]|uniref:Uncharacterized protein n=1 Tax=Gossypium stocksii TaxID=47602 RepID=A0A9D3UEU5_9ROSI|nr:hypothetical protein J1N35_041107 [Gossypium stocksii]